MIRSSTAAVDALIYACYQDARFLLVSTPSGISLAPEGGQHQSVNTPLVGMSVDRLASYEPTHVDELLAVLLRFAFAHMQAPDGSAVWLRLSTRALLQPQRVLDDASVIAGGHWAVPPAAGAPIALAYQGPIAEEAIAAFAVLRRRRAGCRPCSPSPAPTVSTPAGSPPQALPPRRGAGDEPYRAASLPPRTGAPRWSPCSTATPPRTPGSAACAASALVPLGVDRFGPERRPARTCTATYGLDESTILDACAQALLG